MKMDVVGLQQMLGTTADGKFGPASRAALLDKFSNRDAPAVTSADKQAISAQLGVTVRQLDAVASVESSGGGFDRDGRPKILFERHFFHRLTGGKWTPASFSMASGGGYDVSSWAKLLDACARDPEAAFASASWGKFQVMGAHWSALGYASSYELAVSTVAGEAAHYELLARFITHNRLQGAMRAISGDPEACRAFARGYNGPAYAKLGYHEKLARAMR